MEYLGEREIFGDKVGGLIFANHSSEIFNARIMTVIIHYTTWHILKRNQWHRRGGNSITYDYDGAKGNQVEENGGSSCHCLSSTNWIATQFKRLCYYLYRHKWLCVWLPSSIYFALKYRSCQVLSFLYTKQNGFVTSHCHPRY